MSFHENIIEVVSENDYHSFVQQNPDALFVLFFYSDHCHNCKRLKPHFIYTHQRLKEEGYLENNPVVMLMLNYMKVPSLVKELEVMGVPTMFFIKSGKILFRFSGLTDSEHIIKKIKSLQ